MTESDRVDRFALKRVDYNYVALVDLKEKNKKKLKAFDVKSSLSTLSLSKRKARSKTRIT